MEHEEKLDRLVTEAFKRLIKQELGFVRGVQELKDEVSDEVARLQKLEAETDVRIAEKLKKESTIDERSSKAEAHIAEVREQLKGLEPLRLELASLQVKKSELAADIEGLENKLREIVSGYTTRG